MNDGYHEKPGLMLKAMATPKIAGNLRQADH